MAAHTYRATVRWTGNTGDGTRTYRGYDRSHVVEIDGKPTLAGSADPVFRGDASAHNPEDLLLASISACHMLWYLHLCSDAGISVMSYSDDADAEMAMEANGAGQFTRATLHPRVTIEAGDVQTATDLHHRAHEMCFIARSLNFPVACEPVIETP